MKVKVKMPFLDKFDNSVLYTEGQILEWDDQERIDDCVGRKLVEIVKAPKAAKETKPKAKKTTGKQAEA